MVRPILFSLARHLPHVIHKVPTRLVVDIWPSLEGFAADAMSHHPFMDEQDLLVEVLHGHVQLFIATDSAGILGFAAMEVLTYPRRKVASILAAGGRRGFLSVLVHELLEQLQKWAAEQGADTFAVIGPRPGFAKYARKHLAHVVPGVTLWKRLGDGEGRHSQQADTSLGAMERRPAIS